MISVRYKTFVFYLLKLFNEIINETTTERNTISLKRYPMIVNELINSRFKNKFL